MVRTTRHPQLLSFAVVMGVFFLLLSNYVFASAPGAVAAITLAVVVGYAFSWLGAAIAAKVRDPEMVGMLSMLWLFPLRLASTGFAPAESMPGWLQRFATYQPISVAARAVLALGNGTPAGTDVLAALGWTVAMLAVLVPLSTRLYRSSL